jgi:hypothetical protein
MFRWLVFIFSFLLILGCGSQRGIKKKYLLDRNTFVDLLVDIHLAYAIQGSSEYHEIARKYDSIDVHSIIFRKYDVEKAAFDSTMSYYTKKPEDLIKIYDEVIMRLNQLQDSVKVSKQKGDKPEI